MKKFLPLAIGLYIGYRLLKKKAEAPSNGGGALPQPPKAPPPSALPNIDPNDRPTTYPPAGGTGGIYTGGGQVQPL